jgi:orotate phosphoribosyltransferase
VNKEELARAIYQVSHIEGTFVLRSGQVSNEYFDKYLFESDPHILKSIAIQMKSLVPAGTEILAGLEMGGIPIATALSLETGLPLVLVRKKPKDYGTCKVAEGIDFHNKKICVVEDVVTTGGQVLLSTRDLRSFGAKVDHVIGVILRGVESSESLKEEGLKLSCLFSMDELKNTAIQ